MYEGCLVGDFTDDGCKMTEWPAKDVTSYGIHQDLIRYPLHHPLSSQVLLIIPIGTIGIFFSISISLMLRLMEMHMVLG